MSRTINKILIIIILLVICLFCKTKNTYAIFQKIDISKYTVTGIQTSYTYTGGEIRPKPTAVFKCTIFLTEGKDYSISYKYNINSTAVSRVSAQIIITGKNNFKGQIIRYFSITRKSIMTLRMPTYYIPPQAYNGGYVTPDFDMYNGQWRLKKGIHYTMYYSNNINANESSKKKAHATIQGIGNYCGTLEFDFIIKPKSITTLKEPNSIPNQEYTGQKIKPDVALYNGQWPLKKDTHYTINYENNVNVSTSAKKAKAILKGIGNYTGTITMDFNIVKPLSKCSVTLSSTSAIYSGQPLTPYVTVKDNGKVVDKSSYRVGYSYNTEIGTATVTVKGKGFYTGTVTRMFDIRLNFNTCIASTTDYSYVTGKQIKPSVKIKCGNQIIKQDFFDISYGTNRYPGEGTITVTPKTKYVYGDAKKLTFKIRLDLSKCDVKTNIDEELEDGFIQYTGKEIEPEIDGFYKNGTYISVPSKEYKVYYGSNTFGEAYIKISGNGDYCINTKIINFSIIYNQNDDQYKNTCYGNDEFKTLYSSGCGSFAMANSLSHVTAKNITPEEVTDALNTLTNNNEGGKYYNHGSMAYVWSNEVAQYFGCHSLVGINDKTAALALKAGNAIIASQPGHIFALIPTGDKENFFKIVDSWYLKDCKACSSISDIRTIKGSSAQVEAIIYK